jgi:hypothetical protein
VDWLVLLYACIFKNQAFPWTPAQLNAYVRRFQAVPVIAYNREGYAQSTRFRQIKLNKEIIDVVLKEQSTIIKRLEQGGNFYYVHYIPRNLPIINAQRWFSNLITS